MINLNSIKRGGLRLLCLLAAILALSQSAGAYNAASIKGYYNYVGLSSSLGEWKYTDMTRVDDSNYYFDLTPTSAGTAYIIFKLNNDEFGPSGNAVLPTSEPSATNAKKGSGQMQFEVSSDNVNKKHTIHVYHTTSNNDNAKIWITVESGSSKTYSINVYSDGSTETYEFSGSGTSLTKEVASWSNGTYGFKISDGSSTWTSSNENISNGSLQSLSENNEMGGNMKLNGADGKKVTFALTIGSNGNPSTLTATWDNGGTPVTGNVYIVGEWPNHSGDWDDKGTQITDQSGTVYTYTITPATSGDIKYRFKVGSTVYYPKGGDALIESGKTYETETTNGSGCFWLRNAVAGRTYTIKFDTNDHKVKMTWDGSISYSDIKMEVYPIGIYSDQELAEYKEPIYYLLGDALNASRVTPEYQFVKITDDVIAKYQKEGVKILADQTDGGTDNTNIDNNFNLTDYKGQYILDLTMRNTRMRWTEGDGDWGDHTMKVVGYETPDASMATYVSDYHWNKLKYKNNGNEDKDYRTDYLEGWRCIAVFNPSASGDKLIIRKVKDGKLPYISLVGAGWKQNTVGNPDEDGDGKPDPFVTPRNKNTDEGWQEAWIQYDDRGIVAKDRDGKVMYNTMWPPRNEMKFKIEFPINGTNYDFTVRSNELTLQPTGETKSGENWKKDNRFLEQGGIEGRTLNNSEITGDTNDYTNKLALDDSRDYVLYEVKNVWIYDKMKFWTGWTGGNNNDKGGANWNNHTNWGHLDEQGSDVAAQQINVKSTVPLSWVNGDMVFEKPTYFKTMWFFYDKNDGLGKGRSVFFTEIAMGGAQIAALNHKDYEYGYFQPGLSQISGVKNVKSVKITCWSSDGKDMVNGNVFSSDAQTAPKEFCNLFGKKSEDLGEKTQSDIESISQWIFDPTEYANGDYIYRMEVELSADGANYSKITVDSNPFTIHRSQQQTKLVAYQLVKVLNPADGYNYVTYYKSGDTDWAQNAYEVQVEVGEGDKDPVLKGYRPLAQTPDYADGTKYQFTCKVLLVSNRLSGSDRNNVLGYQLDGYDASSKTIVNGLPHGQSVKYEFDNNQDYGTEYCSYSFLSDEDKGRYFRIVEPRITIFSNEGEVTDDDNTTNGSFTYTYKVKMKYNDVFVDASTGQQTSRVKESTEGEVTHNLVMPTPVLNEAHVELFYGADDTFSAASNDAVKTFTYGGLELDNARYQNVRKVLVIERPNITDRYRAKARKYVENVTDNDLGSKYAPISNGLFGYRIGSEGSNTAVEDLVDNYVPKQLDENTVRYEGITHIPSNFDKNNGFIDGASDGKIVALEMKEAFKDQITTFNRWTNGVITGISLDRDMPMIQQLNGQTEEAYKVTGASFSFNAAGHLIETVKVHMKFKTTDYDLSDVNSELVNQAKDGVTSDGNSSDGVNYARRYKPGTDRTALAKPLLFGNAMFEKNAAGEQKYFDYYYLSLADPAGTVMGVETTDGSEPSATELVLTAKSLREGVNIVIKHDHGTWWEGMEDYIAPYCRGMKLNLSYLYPFDFTKKETPAAAPMRAAAAEETETDVVKSDPADITFGNDIPTSIEGITMFGSGSVKAGEGYIETRGEGIEIYGADGIRVASGEGRHEVPAGVYVVRLGGASQKVIVR